MKRLLLAAALAVGLTSPALADTYNGTQQLWNPACNSARGGIVGQTYSDGQCQMPGGGSSSGGGVGTAITSTSTPTATTGSAYATGAVVGGIQSFTSQPTAGGVVINAEVTFSLTSGAFSGSWDLVLFGASPTGGGTSDNAAYNLTSTDLGKVVGVLHLTDCTPQNAAGTVVQCQVPQPFTQQFNLASGTTVYGVAVVRGTPNLSANPIFSLLTLH